MTKERHINSETESFSALADRPVDELAAFIGGDIDVFNTFISEVNKLPLSEEEKSAKLKNIYEAAKASGINFATLEQAESVVGELDK